MRSFVFWSLGRRRGPWLWGLVLVLAGSAGRAQEEPRPLAGEAAGAAIEQAWSASREIVSGTGDPAVVDQELGKIRRLQWEAGIRDLPLLAAALLRIAAEQNREGRTEAAERSLAWSRRLAPDHADFHLARARYWLTAGPRNPAAAWTESRKFWRSCREDFECSVRLLARAGWIVLWMGWVALGLLAVALVALYLRLYVHDFFHLFPSKVLPRRLVIALALCLPWFPLMFGAPLWVIAGAWIALMSLYSRTGERVIALALVAGLGGLPWVHGVYARLLSAPSDPGLAAVLKVRQGIYSADEEQVLLQEAAQEPPRLEVLMALAAIHSREGRIEEAGQDFQRLLAQTKGRGNHLQAVIYNNLGNLWVAAGNPQQALASYQAAAETNPLPVETAYNLSQLYHALLDIPQGNAWNNRADAIAPEQVEEWVEVSSGLPLAQRVAEMQIPLSLLWDRVWQDSPRVRAVAQSSWREWAGGMSRTAFLTVWAGVGLAIVAAWSLAGRLKISRSCASCGQPVCPRCHRLSKDPNLCSPCYHVFREQAGIDPRVKLERKAYARRFQENWYTTGLLTSVALPGFGHLLQGMTGRGIVLMLLASIWLAALLAPAGVWRPAVPVFADGVSFAALAAGAGYLLLSLLGTISYVARFRD